MGSGKTTLGKMLAGRLDYHFVDLDQYIEKETGYSISTIFERSGEDGFRVIEFRALNKSIEWDNTVVAVGGGAIVTDAAVDFALRNGLLVYLSASEETINERVAGTSHFRPILKNAESFKALLSDRKASYEQAHILYATDDETPHESISGLVNGIKTWAEKER